MLYLRVYVKDNAGNYTYSDLMPYSVRTYCKSRLEKSSDEKLKATCVSMLHYGAAAQVYFNYRTDDLANAGIIEKYPNPAWDASLLDALETVNANIPTSAGFTLQQRTLSLDDTVNKKVSYTRQYLSRTERNKKANRNTKSGERIEESQKTAPHRQSYWQWGTDCSSLYNS